MNQWVHESTSSRVNEAMNRWTKAAKPHKYQESWYHGILFSCYHEGILFSCHHEGHAGLISCVCGPAKRPESRNPDSEDSREFDSMGLAGAKILMESNPRESLDLCCPKKLLRSSAGINDSWRYLGTISRFLRARGPPVPYPRSPPPLASGPKSTTKMAI